MRMVNLATVAVFAILAAGPALAGDPRGGSHGGGGHPGGGCGSSCGGGGHRPPPAHGGGYNGNINVNVNANASATAWAGASAGGYINARAYDVGGIRGRGHGGTVYVGGGYGGDVGGYYGGGAVYNEEIYGGRACASAPFGYVVSGFGREGRRPPACLDQGRVVCRGDDRGGRYGYSERRGCDGGRREEHYGSYERSGGSYESYESYEEYDSWSGGYREDRGYDARHHDDRRHDDGRRGRDCDCRPDHASYRPEPTPYTPAPHHAPEPPAWTEPPAWRDLPPRQYYSQEPGGRG